MKKRAGIFSLVALALICPGSVDERVTMLPGQSCTIVYAGDGKTVLAGNNEDWNDFFPKLHFIPGKSGKFGMILFGFNVERYPQGGVNERGLFFDAAVAETVVVPPDPDKTPYKGSLILKAMEECESVEQVLARFKTFDSSGDWNGHYLVGDRFGHSAIIEPLTIIQKSGSTQVITNFLQSRTQPEAAACDRYRMASALLGESKSFSIDLFKRILNATHYENSGQGMIATQYSYICDLKRGRIHVYNFHNFQQEVVLDIGKELQKGERCITIQSLFPGKSFAQVRYESERVQALLHQRMTQAEADGMDGFMELFSAMKAHNEKGIKNEQYDLSERQLLSIGSRLAKEGMAAKSIAVLELTCREYPRSAPAFKALADAYLNAKRVDQAVDHYKKSYQIVPPAGPYFGQPRPGLTPQLFAPGFISTDERELNSVFTPDGREFYFSVAAPGKGYRMYVSRLAEMGWTERESVSFSGDHSDVDMFISRDGQRIFFGSTRPVKGGNGDFKIWVADRTGDGWSAPRLLDSPLNGMKRSLYITISDRGTAFFQGIRAESFGDRDIYSSELKNGTYSEPVHLGREINSEHGEGDVLIAPDESYLIVSVVGRPDSLGDSDLYITFRQADGTWSTLRNMGAHLNSPQSDYCPMLSPDGKYFFFTSARTGNGDIYWVDARVIDGLRAHQPGQR